MREIFSRLPVFWSGYQLAICLGPDEFETSSGRIVRLRRPFLYLNEHTPVGHWRWWVIAADRAGLGAWPVREWDFDIVTPAEQMTFDAFKRELRSQLPGHVYDEHFASLTLFAWDGSRAIFGTGTSGGAAAQLMQAYAHSVCNAWLRACGPFEELQLGETRLFSAYELGADEKKAANDTMGTSQAATGALKRRPRLTGESSELSNRRALITRGEENSVPFDGRYLDDRVRAAEDGGTLQHDKTLDTFCVNATNRMARKAVMRMLEGTGAPITYVYGVSGWGKSHLINAAALEWLRRNPSKRLMYLHYDSLVADVSDACVSNSVKELKAYLQDTDLLVFDDVHLLRGRKRTQEELACLIDKLVQAGKPVLVAGTLAPAELAKTGILQRLSDRLLGGLPVAIEAPDFELRLRFAIQRATMLKAQRGIVIPQRHLELVARRCDQSLREVEGVLRRLDLEYDPGGPPITDDQVRTIISDTLDARRHGATIDDLFDYCCEVCGVTRDEMASKSRRQPLVRARQAFALAARKLTDAPLTEIGAMVCRDHTTIIHSIDKAEIIAETDQQFADRISSIFEQFQKR